MKIVCDSCGEVAEPAEIWRSGERLRLECAACGFMNEPGGSAGQAASNREAATRTKTDQGTATDVSGGDEAAAEPTAAGGAGVDTAEAETRAAPADEPDPDASSSPPATDAERPWLAGPAHSPAVPEVQCPKCGARQRDDESCDRCGFAFANYRPGDMPWERAQEVNADLIEGAEPLWAEALATGTEAAHEAFFEYCLEHDLDDYAGRRYRFHVADWPEDALAATMLDRMLGLAQARMSARLDVERDRMREGVSTVRRRLLFLVFLAGLALAVALYSLYPRLS